MFAVFEVQILHGYFSFVVVVVVVLVVLIVLVVLAVVGCFSFVSLIVRCQ